MDSPRTAADRHETPGAAILAQLARVKPANDVAAKRKALAPAKSAWSRELLVAFGGAR